ncbi:helix-turn-helix domain-containing protein [Pseudomonadota bacterium]
MINYLVLPTGKDIKAARNYLDWSQMELAFRVGVNAVTINTIENNKSKPSKELLERFTKLFMENSIKFMPNGGFNVEKEIATVYNGRKGFLRVVKDMLEVCGPKDEILLLGGDDRKAGKEVNDLVKKIYAEGVKVKHLIAKDNNYTLGPLEDYRQIDKAYFLSKDVVFIYKNKVMISSECEFKDGKYDEENQKLLLISDSGIYEQFKAYFYRLWKKGVKPKKSSTKQIFFYKK